MTTTDQPHNVFGGIFREEVAQQLLDCCMRLVNNTFAPLHTQCERKVDGSELFTKCVDQVRTAWTEDDFAQETSAQGAGFDTVVRGSFILYVRQTYVDPSGAQAVQIRLTVPPTTSFMREFLKSLSSEEELRSGSYGSLRHA